MAKPDGATETWDARLDHTVVRVDAPGVAAIYIDGHGTADATVWVDHGTVMVGTARRPIIIYRPPTS